MRASEQLATALANEGVEYIFGIPGDENLHFIEAIRKESRIRFILCRHEQAAGFMAATYGRLTGKLAVAMATLGAGSTNLTTAVAHAYLAGIPMLLITGQKAIRNNKMGQYQLIDVVDIMRPITKFTATVPSGMMLASITRQAMMSALTGRMGPAHIELPEDIMLDEELGPLVPCRHGDTPTPSVQSIQRAAEILRNAKSPLIMVGGGTRSNRPEVAGALRKLIEKTKIPFVVTMMGKGVALEKGELYIGTSIMPGDYTHCAVREADVILNVGHDVQEKPTFQMSPEGGKTVIHLNPFPAHGDPVYFPQHQVVGDMTSGLEGITRNLDYNPNWNHATMYKAARGMQESIARYSKVHSFPAHPAFVAHTLREFMDSEDILSLDNGIHMMWISRNFPAYQPNTMLVDHALGSMGVSLPAAIAAKMIYPEKKVIVVTGDGGFMMNSQELETAVRLNLDLIVIIFNDSGLGMIEVKQMADGYGKMGVGFNNPDFEAYTNSFGAHGHRLNQPSKLKTVLKRAVSDGGVHVIDIPIDKKQNMILLKEMKSVDCTKL